MRDRVENRDVMKDDASGSLGAISTRNESKKEPERSSTILLSERERERERERESREFDFAAPAVMGGRGGGRERKRRIRC